MARESGRVIACDDGIVNKLGQGWTVAACVLWDRDEGPLRTASLPIHVDGLDATQQLSFIARHLSRLSRRVDAVLLDSVSIGGFNLVSLSSLSRAAGSPVIVCYKRKPRWSRIESALKKHFEDYYLRIKIISIVKNTVHVDTRLGSLYLVIWGTSPAEAKSIVEEYQYASRIPEPLRYADLYASALSRALIQLSETPY